MNLFFISNGAATCEGETIDQCTACDTGEDSDSCGLCEPGYFPFLGNYFCLACNDTQFGMIGCDGNCDGTNFTRIKRVACEEGGCSEGFINMDGICQNCSEYRDGCTKCSYEIPENRTFGTFKCLECERNQYKLTVSGNCQKCYIYGCEECHYNENYTEQICDKCKEKFYKNEEGKCTRCRSNNIEGGTCYICSENGTEYDFCECQTNYIKVDDFQCFKCPNNCKEGFCSYNNETNETECQNCYSGFNISSDKKCISCGDNCYYCIIDENDNPICQSCYYFYILDKGKCITCDSKCSKCYTDESSKYKNETICSQCSSGYALSPEGKCVDCNNIQTGGNGCSRCSYNEISKNYECSRCNGNSYVYINNTYHCYYNTFQNETNLYGCSLAQYDEKNKKYECFRCRSSFLYIEKDKTCRNPREIGLSSYCQKIDNLGTINEPKYTCLTCRDYTTYVTNNSVGINYCIPRTNESQFCKEGIIEENGDFKCTQCVDHATINSSNICECDSDSFEINEEQCFVCDDKDVGNIGCNPSKGCFF
jgi:hypothetical protein